MIDIWNALSMEHKISIIALVALIPLIIYRHIDSYGGWTLYLSRRKKPADRFGGRK